MKYHKLKLAALALLIGALTASAQPADAERYSTEPQRDMKHLNLKGRIEKIEGQRAVLRTEKGERVTVNLGPERFWRERGYHLNEGVRVRVDGWGDLYDEDGGYIFAGGIYGDGFSFEISDSRGFPMWADRDDYDEGWCPQRERFEVYYFGTPWLWGPPPRWWAEPRWRWHHYWYRHHYAPHPPRHWDRDRYHDRDRGRDRDGGRDRDRDRDGGGNHDRGGGRGRH
jgi:hypothetical protein